MDSNLLRIGIIGGGNIVRQRHMPGLMGIGGIEFVSVCNRRPESTHAFAEDFHIPKPTQDWHEIVRDPDVDLVWIGTTPYLHAPIILEALEASKHVFCQARMCMNLDEARQIVAVAQEHSDRVLRFCPPPMGMGCDRTMRRLLHDEQVIGDIRQCELVSTNGSLLDPAAPLTWRLQREQSGQHVLTMGIYFEVLNRWFGLPTSVTAVNQSWTAERPNPETDQPIPAEIPESVNVIAEWADGMVGVCLFNGVSAHSDGDRLTVHGTKGTLVYHFNPDETQEYIEVGKIGSPTIERLDIPNSERVTWPVEADFISAINHPDSSTESIVPDAQTALKYMAFVDAVHRSSALHSTVAIADVEHRNTL